MAKRHYASVQIASFFQLEGACMFSSTSKTGSWAWAMVFLGGVVLIADIVSIQMVGSNAKQFESVVGSATVEVLVATRDLPVGAVLLADEKPWIVKAVPKNTASGAVTKDADLTNKRLTRAVRTGEPFRPDDLVPVER